MSAVSGLPQDHPQRLAALDPLVSVCVTAPAGSGKTELLTQRVLRLLARVDKPEEILAITFTRKAAAEMHHRILQSLVSAAGESMPEAPHKKLSWELAREALAHNERRGWRLLENPSRLKVQTIDSFCAALTRQMPVLSNFGAQPQITDQAGGYYETAVRQLLARLEHGDRLADALASVLAHTDNDPNRLQRLLIDMLQRRDQWLVHLGVGADIEAAKASLERTLDRIIVDTLTAVRTQLQGYAAELVPLLDYAGRHMQQPDKPSTIGRLMSIIELPEASADALQAWQAIADVLLTSNRQTAFRRSINKNCGFPTETHDGDKQLAKERKRDMEAVLEAMSGNTALLSALERFRALPDAHFAVPQWLILNELLLLLPALVAELSLVFQQSGVVDHTQIALGALQALGSSMEPSELALKLDHRLRHILIDEFQDTSSTQYRLLERLTEGWREYNDVHPDTPNTIFLVGDGMQSIYGFRHANVGLFLEAKRCGVNGVVLQDIPLTVNFRSSPEVVDWNNRVFSQAFPAQENLSRGAVPYAHSMPFHGEDSGASVTVSGFVGDDPEYREALHIVDQIVALQEHDPAQSIAVLVRSRSHLKPLIRELSRRQLHWNAADIDPLDSYDCVMDLLSLTRAMLNIADRVSWSALLRTPWFGLTHSDLHALLQDSGKGAIWCALAQWQGVEAQLSNHARQRLGLTVPLLARAFGQRQRLPFRVWLEGLWMSLGGPAALADPRDFDLVDRFFDALEQYQVGAQPSAIGEFENTLRTLYAKPDSADSSLHLMTIHKSKGLEFDTVILPCLGKSTRGDDNPLLLWREYLSDDGRHSGLVIGALPVTGADDAIYSHLLRERSASQALENTRLLYVAATRAVRRLVLSFATELDERTEQPKAPRKNSLLDCIWTAIEQQVQWPEPGESAAGQLGLSFDNSAVNPAMERIRSSWKRPAWSFPNPLSDYYLVADADGDNLPEAAGDTLAIAVGVAVHSIFEALRQHGIGHWQSLTLQQKALWAQRLLERHALQATQVVEGISQVLQAVDNTVQDGRGRWLLSPCANIDFAEWALSSCHNQGVRHRVIDRVLRDEQGGIWIVDYKTAVPKPGEARQHFVERECLQYRGQLLSYRSYVGQLLDNDAAIRIALYFTAIPLLCELEGE